MQIREYYLLQKEKRIKRISSRLNNEFFCTRHLDAIERMISLCSFCPESEKEVLDFAYKLFRDYGE
jgi:hypothetical protein